MKHGRVWVAMLVLALCAGRAAAETVASPGGPLGVERFDRLELLPFLDPLSLPAQDSSHAPDGGNVDFYLPGLGEIRRGPHLYRDSGGRFVLLEAMGPGALTRVFLGNLGVPFDALGSAATAGRLQIFFDGESTPRVDLPATRFFSGHTPPFLAPLCGDYRVSSGGNYCYVTMPYQRSVKVTVTGQPNWWDINYETYPADTEVATFDPADAIERAVSAAARLERAGENPEILPLGAVHSATTVLEPGAEAVLLSREGPGTLRAIELTLDADGVAALGDLWLEARWDAHEVRDVAAPLADLFLSGAGERSPARGLLAGYVPAENRGYLYFPMPFASGAEVKLSNRGNRAVTVTSRIEESTATYPNVGTSTGELRATLEEDPSTPLGTDTRLLEADGRGRVVGYSFTEEGPYAPFLEQFLEGDERIYFDGSATPQIYGSGHEEFSNGGFYYNVAGPFSRPTHGVSAKEAAPAGARVAQYRLLLGDSWTFRRGIRMGIEHGGGNGLESATRAVVFWYGADAPAAELTDSIDVGDPTSEALHEYGSDASEAVALTGFYEGDRDGNTSSPLFDTLLLGALPLSSPDFSAEAVSDRGRHHPPGAKIRFLIAVDPANEGVLLRRRLDQAVFSQTAAVSVDGSPAGVWMTAGANEMKRWADADLLLPPSLTAGKSAVSVELVVLEPERLPLVVPVVPETLASVVLPAINLAAPSSGWTDFRYEAFSIVP